MTPVDDVRKELDEAMARAEKRRADRRKEFLDEIAESLGRSKAAEPHMHPPSVEACRCTNTSRFRLPLTKGDDA